MTVNTSWAMVGSLLGFHQLFALGDLLASDGVSVQVLGLGSRWLCCGLFVSHCCDVRVLLVWAARRDTMPRQTFRFDSPRLRIDCKPREQSFSIRLWRLIPHITAALLCDHECYCRHGAYSLAGIARVSIHPFTPHATNARQVFVISI